MLQAKPYVAIQSFSLSLDNGQNVVTINAGEKLVFDGLNVITSKGRGTARPLAKVVGEWIQELSPTQTATPAPTKVVRTPARPSRNATAGRVIENSSPANDLDTLSSQESSHDELVRLVGRYENNTPISTPAQGASNLQGQNPTLVSDTIDAQREANNIRIINQDEEVVAKVSSVDSAPANTSGVQISDQKESKMPVITMEERVVKETNYSGKVASDDDGIKHITVDKDAGGVEVLKTSSPAINKGEVRSSTADTGGQPTVYREQEAVLETQYEAPKATDVSSSTTDQAHKDDIATKKSTKKKAAKKKAAKKSTKKSAKAKTPEPAKEESPQESDAPLSIDQLAEAEGIIIEPSVVAPQEPTPPVDRKPVIVQSDAPSKAPEVQEAPRENKPEQRQNVVVQGQDGVVVGKVRKISEEKIRTQEGVTSNVKVGSEGEMSDGDVEFSDIGDLEVGEVTVGSGEDSAVDVGSDDIDVDDILKGL